MPNLTLTEDALGEGKMNKKSLNFFFFHPTLQTNSSTSSMVKSNKEAKKGLHNLSCNSPLGLKTNCLLGDMELGLEYTVTSWTGSKHGDRERFKKFLGGGDSNSGWGGEIFDRYV
ncbi:hypothetical protein CEXT_216721 [Caerostris extrusa]|uniref:Uncharacterized protein n=1 Tax=Caerostris extrusa TaxID=172846 RepID=A0AAV4VTY5_CAEEX|nr:hypothetical protein CEXT_216721 [Caerostris extrusa]